MASLIFPFSQQYADLNVILNDADWSTFIIGLTKAPLPLLPVPDLATCLANECDFNGYVQQAWAGVLLGVFDSGIFGFLETSWPVAGAGPANQIYNVFILDGAATKVISFGDLSDTPVSMQNVNDTINLNLAIAINGGLTSVFPST